MITFNYLLPDIEHLKVLLRFKIDGLIEKQGLYEENWIKNNKCACVFNLREGITINCEHYNKSIKKEFEKEENNINKLSSFIIKLELSNNPQFPSNWLQRLKL